MKKVVQLVAALSFGLAVLTTGVSAQTAQCYITGTTGPGSNNTCTNSESLSCQVLNNNIISINNNNVEVSTSGNSDASNNTSVSYVVTGPATNNNSSAVSGTIVNGGCVPTTVATPGMGGSTPAPVTAAAAAPETVKALPKTSSASPIAYISALIALLGAAVIASRLSVLAYSKRKN